MNPTKIYHHTGKLPKIHCEQDYRDIRIYINGMLHIIIPRPIVSEVTKDSIRLQSYLVGSRAAKRYFIEVGTGENADYYGYDNFEMWKRVLELLDQNI